MLSEADKLLITAGVCGCLSRVEKTALRILLEESPAAKALYKTAPDSIWPNVMARVASGPIIVPPIVPNRQGVAGWLPFAVAASLLVGVTALSYKMFLVPANRNEVADKSSKPIVELQPNRISPPLAANETTAPAPVFVGPPKPDTVVAMAPLPSELAPKPRIIGRQAPFTAAVPDPTVFTTIDARLPVLFPIADAADAEVIRKVKAEFAAGNAIRIDLFAKDTLKAADQFAAAVRAGHTTLAVDGITQMYLKRKLRLAWAVYTESLAAPDALAVLNKLAADDAKPGATPVWVAAHLTATSTADGREAKDLFGLDPAAWKKAKTSVKPAEPLTAGTIDQLTAALGKSTPAAVMTTFLPTNLRIPPNLSPQIKQYFEEKPAKKDGAVPLLVVIRPTS
jgi:hypothetical protein